MKKWIYIALCLVISVGIMACGNSDKTSEKTESQPNGTEDIDVDLTALSSTMVYSEVYNIMTEPDSYIGKTIRMGGTYTVYYDETSDHYYFACIIQDATACCSQGMEFTLTDSYSYPEDYPDEGEKIVVTGIFDTYTEGEYKYCTLRNATLD